MSEPPAPEASQHVPSWREHARSILDEELDGIEALFGLAGRAYREPVAGSPHAADLEWISAHQHSDRFGAMALGAREDVLQMLVSSLDFVEALGTQIEQDRLLVVPMLSMVRSVFDTLMRVAHMLDPDVSTELRLARAADQQLATASETIAANEVLGLDNSDFVENRKDLVAWYARIGIEEKLNKKGDRQAVVLGDAEQSVRWSTTQVARRAAPRATYLWKHGSGATHNEYWFTAALSGSDEQVLIMVVEGLLATSDVLADVLAGYLEIDVAPAHEATHRRRRRLHAGPGGDPGEQTYADYAARLDALRRRPSVSE